MSKLKKHTTEKVRPSDDSEPLAAPETPQEPVKANITCSYGIHRGNFPVAGLKVKEARAILKKLIKVDDQAIAVINGENVSEEEVISADTTLLSFVKPSALKGAETISIDGSSVKMDGKKLAVDNFCNLISQNTISGLDNEPIPDNVKWVVRAGKLAVYIAEFKPELRWIKWLADDSPAPYGGAATYKHRKLATPYVVMKTTFVANALQGTVELFYRNLPLAGLDDELFHCNLYNVSPGAYDCKAWFCTQYLNVQRLKGPTDILSGILSHVWGGGFNASSEANEGRSGFSLAQEKKIDQRVTDVNRWEKESEKDPRFVLGVDWVKAGTSPRDLIQRELHRFQVAAPATSKALGNILLASKLMV